MSLIDTFYNATTALSYMKTNKTAPQEVKTNFTKFTEAFQLLLQTTKWSDCEFRLKLMAAESIPKYVEYYPSLQEQAMNVQLVSFDVYIGLL
jgi:hypothetical protein